MITALEVSDKEIAILSARPAGKGIEIVSSQTVPIGEDGLGAALAKLDASGRIVLVIPRAKAILREFQIPEGSDEEVIQMIRFQVEKELPLPLDQMRYSFAEISRADGKILVQVAAAPHTVLNPILEALGAAGFKTDVATVSTFGLASLVAEQEAPVAIVGLTGGTLEILVADRGAVAVSRSSGVPAQAVFEDFVKTEVDRTVLAYHARGGGRHVSKIIIPSQAEALGLNGTLAGTQGWSLSTAPLAGICLATVAKNAPMPDLLHPPVVVKKFQIPRKYRIGGLIVAILALTIFGSQKYLSDKQAKLDGIKKELKKLDPEVAQVKRKDANTKMAQEWKDERYPWYQLMTEISKTKISSEHLYIMSVTIGEKGSVLISGKSTTAEVYERFREELKHIKFLRNVESGGPLVPGGKEPWKNQFTLKAQLVED